MLLSVILVLLSALAECMDCSTASNNAQHQRHQGNSMGSVNARREETTDSGSYDDEEDEFTGTITAISGCGFVRRYSPRTFIDSQWTSARGLRVFLKTRDDKSLFANSWVSVDSKDSNIVGFPLPGNYGEFVYLLCAENAKGQKKKRKIKIKIIRDKNMAMHHVVMKMSSGFTRFVSNPYRRMRFASLLAEYMQQKGMKTNMQDIWVTSTDSMAHSITWVLSTYNRNTCSNILTDDLPRILTHGKLPHPDLSEKLQPYFTLSSVSVIMSQYCPRPTVFKSGSKSNTDLFVGPILLIIIALGLSSPILIAYLIRRGIRKREFRRAGSVRHVFTNGNATPIGLDMDEVSGKSNSDDNISRKLQYRWSPDFSNRPPVHIPNFPPPRPRLQEAASLGNSEDSVRPSAWHGLPMDQCAEQEGVQIADIVQSISQSASTLKNFFTGSSEKVSASSSRPCSTREEDSFSVKSDGNKILETALQKVTSLINMNNFSAPTLIRISRLDIDNDSTQTRRSSMDTRNSSFECSVVSSDYLTTSQISSGVNSFDTEILVSSASFSQDESTNDENSLESEAKDEYSEVICNKARPTLKLKTQNNEESGTKGTRQSMEIGFSQPQQKNYAASKNSDLYGMAISPAQFEVEVHSIEPIVRIRGNSLRRPLQRMPTLQLTDAETVDAETFEAESFDAETVPTNTDLLHPWYIDEDNVYTQQTDKEPPSQNSTTKPSNVDKNGWKSSRSKYLIYKYDESSDMPIMV